MANVWKLNKNGQSHKIIEWVKLIDYDYSQKEGQSMIKIDSKEVLWNGIWKRSQGLGVQVFNLKAWRCLHNIYLKFESNVWKGLGQNGWMDEDGV
jgi:hypothetical protein